MLQTFAAIVENTRENLIPLGKQYTDLSKAQADIANIPDGAVIYVLSPLSDVLADEYKNISGVLTTTGKQMAAKGYTDNVINSLKSSGLIPEVMNPETGYVLAFRDPESKRSCFHITVTGQVEIPLLQYQNGSIERPALQEEIQRLIPMTLDPSTGYILAWIDPVTRRMALRVSVSGEVDIPLLKIADGAIEPEMLSPNLQGLVPVYLNPDSGYVMAWVDPVTRRCAMRVTVTGQVEIPLLAIGKNVITADNLTDSLRGSLMPVAQDVVSVYPDALRSRIAELTARTNDKDGSGWVPLSSHICRALFGVNTTGTALEYRRSFGLKVAGKAQGVSFNPGSVASITRRGRLTSPTISTPSGTFSAGDYYSYEAYNTNSSVSETAPGNWNGQNVYLGDLLVCDGTSWSIQRSPGSGAPRKNDTWYEVTAPGVFAGMTLAAGDKLLFLTLQTAGGGFLQPQFAAVSAGADLLFYAGEFFPSEGMPSRPLQNVIWQASAGGVAGTENFRAGDYALFDGNAWVMIANDAPEQVPDGKSISLRCTASADEWEFRRVDKSAAAVGIRLTSQVASAMKTGLGKKLLLIGDSMFGSGTSGSTIIAATNRTGEVRSYGGSTSDQVLGMFKQEVLSWGDRWAGQVIAVWHGQNNQPKTDVNASQIREASLQIAALAGARDIRCLFLTIMGQREATWNGERLVFPQHENQFAETGYLFELTEWYRRILPGRHAVVYEIMLSAATDAIDPTHPGMTEKQVAARYGVLPWSFFNNAVLPGAMTTSDIHYVGTWSASGLPSGGNHADYYLRIAGGTVGNVLVNNGGTWSEVAIDITHMSQAGGRALAYGGPGFSLGDGYKSIPARDGIAGILMNNYFFK
ncbi:TPA: hypothetical protein NIV15_005362 [Klebsiella pneumoniae]|nr:hypothetical protein [Klebsiella pneumoniae]HCF8185804.1 hypothetical protein [Klebsiella pneumoniae]